MLPRSLFNRNNTCVLVFIQRINVKITDREGKQNNYVVKTGGGNDELNADGGILIRDVKFIEQ